MITMAIFVGLATIMLSLVNWVTRMWTQSERRRVLYERAGGAVEKVADDLRLAIGREPYGVDEVRVRFMGDIDPQWGGQRVMFVRSFETGPERAITFHAGDGKRNALMFRPVRDEDDLDQAIQAIQNEGAPDTDPFTGRAIGDFKPLGGMAQVGYSVVDRVLYRSMRAPAIGSMLRIMPKKTRLTRSIDPDTEAISVESTAEFPGGGGKFSIIKIEDEWMAYEAKDPSTFVVTERGIRNSDPVEHPKGASVLWLEYSTPVVTDCLYLRFDYWSQYTSTWDEMPKRSKTRRGPEKIWDSTRAITDPLLSKFVMHRGKESLHDPSDDVFPQKIRITVCVDSPMPRCVNTKLADDLGESDGMIYVDSTRGFPRGGTDQSYILINDEWIHYKDKTRDAFVADLRGARGTTRSDHGEEDVVRTGHTFRRIVFIPGHREDWEPDEVYYQRLQNIEDARKN